MADIWLILDGQRRMHLKAAGIEEPLAGGQLGRLVYLPPETEEYMIAAAASVALHVLGRNRATGLLGYGSARVVVQPERGEAQLFRILETLAGFRSVGDVDLTDVLRIESSWFPRGATIVVVTPNVREDVLPALLELRRRGLVPIAVIVEPEDFGSGLNARSLSQALEEAGVRVRVVRRGQAFEGTLGQSPPGRPWRQVA
jgi:uncharacterized protein (DUF58 family)